MGEVPPHSTDDAVPVLLLKTRSSPSDAYENLFASRQGSVRYEPHFVPVLEHKIDANGLGLLKSLVYGGKVSNRDGAAYGGIIFTSQRAVEAFATLFGGSTCLASAEMSPHPQASDRELLPLLGDVPIYSVGPATTRSLKAIASSEPLQVFGEHTGNGEALAHFILGHYAEWYQDRPAKPPLLFLVGEQRRDVIPKTLADPKLAAEHRIEVTELVVYGTGVMKSFGQHFTAMLGSTESRSRRWVVVFSPTGCDTMLTGLGLNEGRGGSCNKRDGRTFIVTIGPTTRDYLVSKLGFEPDACASRPSPEGLLDVISKYMN